MQEDRPVEWATVLFFGAAGVTRLVRAVRQRHVFDGLVALFCLFFAGEEMSWGQRVLGLTPPSYFLEHNTQQEMNVHNFGDIFGSPKGPLAILLSGYGLLLPLVAMTGRGRSLLSRIGASPPLPAVIPWFAAAIVLLVWYPFRFTGEWVELLAGSAFLVATGIPVTVLPVSIAAGAAMAFVLAAWSSRSGADPGRVACAAAEIRALADGLGKGAAEQDLFDAASVHKRIWTMGDEGYLDFDTLRNRLAGVDCNEKGESDTRRRFAVDPWGTAYWVRAARTEAGIDVTIYSFGPNRRRDMDADTARAGDDIAIRARISPR